MTANFLVLWIFNSPDKLVSSAVRKSELWKLGRLFVDS